MANGAVSMRVGISIAMLAVTLAGCASTPERIGASYVSPLVYANYDCGQILAERERIATRVHDVAAAQNRQAQNEQIAAGVGLVIFWPALFLLVGPDRREELSNLKGHYDALEQVAIQKRCATAPAAPQDEPKKSKSLV